MNDSGEDLAHLVAVRANLVTTVGAEAKRGATVGARGPIGPIPGQNQDQDRGQGPGLVPAQDLHRILIHLHLADLGLAAGVDPEGGIVPGAATAGAHIIEGLLLRGMPDVVMIGAQ